MSDVTEGLGTAVEGGLLANAVETESGAGEGKACLNCGTALTGAHCHACGQRGDVHRSLGAIGHEILHGVLHLDGKIWRTLPLLAFKPGQLTRRYVDGERAKFVGPMAMFLFSVFLMFAVFQIVGISTPTDLRGNPQDELRTAFERETARVEADHASLIEELDNPDLDEQERARLEQRKSELDDQLAGLRQARQLPYLGELVTSEAAAEEQYSTNGEEPTNAADAGQSSNTIPITTADGSPMNLQLSSIDWIDGAIEKWRENPSLMLYKLQNNAYKFSWLLIPISIPFVWSMFFWKRRFKAYDHAIFVTYSLGFMSLLFITLSLLGVIGVSTGWLIPAAIIIPPIHIFRHLRGAYELGRFSAFVRTIALLFMILFGIGLIFLWLMIALGAF